MNCDRFLECGVIQALLYPQPLAGQLAFPRDIYFTETRAMPNEEQLRYGERFRELVPAPG
jgi:hypothetical protein